jgi:hypothetical protein
MALIFQDPQQRADRGITRGIRQGGADFGGGGAFLGVQNVHDLAFRRLRCCSRFICAK